MFLNPTRTLRFTGSLGQPRMKRGLINKLILLYSNILAMKIKISELKFNIFKMFLRHKIIVWICIYFMFKKYLENT